MFLSASIVAAMQRRDAAAAPAADTPLRYAARRGRKHLPDPHLAAAAVANEGAVADSTHNAALADYLEENGLHDSDATLQLLRRGVFEGDHTPLVVTKSSDGKYSARPKSTPQSLKKDLPDSEGGTYFSPEWQTYMKQVGGIRGSLHDGPGGTYRTYALTHFGDRHGIVRITDWPLREHSEHFEADEEAAASTYRELRERPYSYVFHDYPTFDSLPEAHRYAAELARHGTPPDLPADHPLRHLLLENQPHIRGS